MRNPMDGPRDWKLYVLREVKPLLLGATRSGRQRYYTGVTRDISARIRRHNSGDTKATQGCQWELFLHQDGFTEAMAFATEKWMKRGNTVKKRALLAEIASVDPRDQNGADELYYIVHKQSQTRKMWGREEL